MVNTWVPSGLEVNDSLRSSEGDEVKSRRCKAHWIKLQEKLENFRIAAGTMEPESKQSDDSRRWYCRERAFGNEQSNQQEQ